MLAYIILAAVV